MAFFDHFEENGQRGHDKINTILPAITTLYTNMFISLITYLRALFRHLPQKWSKKAILQESLS